MVFDARTAPSTLGRHPLRVILTRRFARQVVTGRWFTVFASLLIMASSGGTYVFGSYSGALKSALGYDQRTLNTVSFSKDLGANLGVLAGLLNEVAPPWAVLAAGAGMNLAGYLMLYLAASGGRAAARRPAPWLVCLYAFAGANAQTFAATGAVVACVRNFPESRGVVLGILSGFAGLSGAVYTQLYYAFCGGDDPEALLLLVACVPAAVSVLFLRAVRYLPRPRRRDGQENSSDPFFCFLYLSIALACFLLVMIVVQGRVELSRSAHALAATPLLVLLLMPLGVVTKQEYKIHREREVDAALLRSSDPPTITVHQMPSSTITGVLAKKPEQDAYKAEPSPSPTPVPVQSSSSCARCVAAAFRPPARGEDHTILQSLCSVDMLALFAATICGVGGTLTAIDNMGQIGQALGYPPKTVNTFVSLVSIWNYAGRVAAGYASEAALARFRLPRPLLLTLVLLLACAGHLLVAFGASLHAASVVAGFCLGAQWPLVFAVISELFGLKRYPMLYNVGAMASPVGSYVLNVRVAGRLYDAEAARQRNPGGVCLGVECYRRAFLIITAATVLGALVSLVLVWRTWAFYRGDIYARFRDADAGEARLPVVGQERSVVPEQQQDEEEEPGAVTAAGSRGRE